MADKVVQPKRRIVANFSAAIIGHLKALASATTAPVLQVYKQGDEKVRRHLLHLSGLWQILVQVRQATRVIGEDAV